MGKVPAITTDKFVLEQLFKDKNFEDKILGAKSLKILKENFFYGDTRLSTNQELLILNAFKRLNAITAVHSIGVVQNVEMILDANPNLEIDRKTIYLAAALHDIGKSVVNPKLLQSSEKFSEEQREQMAAHSINGGRMLEVLVDTINNSMNLYEPLTVDNLFDSKEQKEQVIQLIEYHHSLNLDYKDSWRELPRDLTAIRILEYADCLNAMSDSLRTYTGQKSLEDVKDYKNDLESKMSDALEDLNEKGKKYSVSYIDISDKLVEDIYSARAKFNKFFNNEIIEELGKISKNTNLGITNLFKVSTIQEVEKLTNLDFRSVEKAYALEL